MFLFHATFGIDDVKLFLSKLTGLTKTTLILFVTLDWVSVKDRFAVFALLIFPLSTFTADDGLCGCNGFETGEVGELAGRSFGGFTRGEVGVLARGQGLLSPLEILWLLVSTFTAVSGLCGEGDFEVRELSFVERSVAGFKPGDEGVFALGLGLFSRLGFVGTIFWTGDLPVGELVLGDAVIFCSLFGELRIFLGTVGVLILLFVTIGGGFNLLFIWPVVMVGVPIALVAPVVIVLIPADMVENNNIQYKPSTNLVTILSNLIQPVTTDDTHRFTSEIVFVYLSKTMQLCVRKKLSSPITTASCSTQSWHYFILVPFRYNCQVSFGGR